MDEPLIHPDLARAATLPVRWYTDPSFLALEHDRVFRRTWQIAGLASKVARPGDYITTEIAGEPLILVHDAEEHFRAISNVCRHRAGPIARGDGNREAFKCGYHGWTYSLEGRLLSAPEFEESEGLRPEEIRLPEARVGSWGPFLFVNLDPGAEPLGAWMGEMIHRTSHIPLHEMLPAERRQYIVNCNWKVCVDNDLEGYHIPVVHPSLFREIDYDACRTETFKHCSLRIAPIRHGEDARGRRGTASGDQEREVICFWIFPNLMLDIHPDHFSTNLVLPLGHDRTRVVFEWFFRDPNSLAARESVHRAVASSDEMLKEDIAVCEAVFRGLLSGAYDRGRYSARRESGVHHFHRLLAGLMGDDPLKA